MTASGGTRLFPALHLAIQLLATTSADRKVVLLLHDGRPQPEDWTVTARLLATMPRTILVQPLYLGADPAIQAANTRLFGHVLACESLDALRSCLCAWLHTL